MKTKAFFTAILFAVTLSASAQVEFLYTDFGRNVICREKKLFWMDGDSDPCFNIVNYKKVGNKETFNLTPKEKGDGKYSVTNYPCWVCHLLLPKAYWGIQPLF